MEKKEAVSLQEKVGLCDSCGKEVYCLDGFLNGVKENGALLCFECADQQEQEEKEHNH